MPEPSIVLLVDDSRSDRYITSWRVRKRWPKATLLEAADGVHAVELLEGLDQLPDFILLDLNMPRMNGYEFLEEWSGKRGMAAPPIIVLTSSQQEEDIRRVDVYPCVRDYLVKPLSNGALETVSAALASSEG